MDENARPQQEQEIQEGRVDWKEACFKTRDDIEVVKQDLQALRGLGCPSGEAAANIMLAYRHLEDARMRMGKAVQALDGGKSCYPR